MDRRLRLDHSPRQIAERLKLEHSDPAMKVSHGTLYRFVREELLRGVRYGRHLRRGDPRWRRPSGKPSPRRRILDGKSIAQRPAAANDRVEVRFPVVTDAAGTASFRVTAVSGALAKPVVRIDLGAMSVSY